MNLKISNVQQFNSYSSSHKEKFVRNEIGTNISKNGLAGWLLYDSENLAIRYKFCSAGHLLEAKAMNTKQYQRLFKQLLLQSNAKKISFSII